MRACQQPGAPGAVGAIAKVIGNAKGFDLSLGDLAGAVASIDRVFDEIVLNCCRKAALAENKLKNGQKAA